MDLNTNIKSDSSESPKSGKKRRYRFAVSDDHDDVISSSLLPYKAICDGFADKTSAHGISHVHQAKGPVKTFFWVFFSIAATGGLIYYGYTLFERFFEWPVSVQVEVQHEPELTFPAITVCNMNPIRLTALKRDAYLSDLLGISTPAPTAAAIGQAPGIGEAPISGLGTPSPGVQQSVAQTSASAKSNNAVTTAPSVGQPTTLTEKAAPAPTPSQAVVTQQPSANQNALAASGKATVAPGVPNQPASASETTTSQAVNVPNQPASAGETTTSQAVKVPTPTQSPAAVSQQTANNQNIAETTTTIKANPATAPNAAAPSTQTVAASESTTSQPGETLAPTHGPAVTTQQPGNNQNSPDTTSKDSLIISVTEMATAGNPTTTTSESTTTATTVNNQTPEASRATKAASAGESPNSGATNDTKSGSPSTNAPAPSNPSSGGKPGAGRKKRQIPADQNKAGVASPISGKPTNNRGQTLKVDFELALQYQQYVADLSNEEAMTMGHNISDFILDCQYSGYECYTSDFYQFYNSKYGNCFVYNSGWDSSSNDSLQVSRRTGPEYGLSLIINIDQDEYVGTFAQEAGIRIVIHNQNVMPFPEDEGITATPGGVTYVGIRKEVISRLADPFSNCTATVDQRKNVYQQYFPVEYTTQSCLKTCIQKHNIDVCNCASSKYPKVGLAFGNVTVTTCDLTNATQSDCVTTVLDQYKNGDLDCECSQSCDESLFTNTISYGYWPSDAYRDSLFTELASENTKAAGIIANVEDTEKYKKNFAKLMIYYEEFNLNSITEQEDYPAGQFVSDIGGILGLFIGFSVLTILEFVELVSDLLVLCCTKNRCKVERRSFKQHKGMVPLTDSISSLADYPYRNQTPPPSYNSAKKSDYIPAGKRMSYRSHERNIPITQSYESFAA